LGLQAGAEWGGRGGVRELLERFEQILIEKELVGRKGNIADTSFVEVPRQRNNRKENEQIKEWERQEGIERTSGFFRAGLKFFMPITPVHKKL
jgi:hypothetical protein